MLRSFVGWFLPGQANMNQPPGRLALIVLLLLPVLLSSPAALQAADLPPVPPAVQTAIEAQGRVRVIVLLQMPDLPDGASAAAQADAIAQTQDAAVQSLPGAQVLRRYRTMPALALAVDADGLRRLQTNPLTARILEDRLSPPALAQSTALIGAPTAWQAGLTGAGWSVAILDTGVERNHPFLVGKTVAEACFSTTDINAGALSLCPGGVPGAEGPGTAQPCNATGCDHGTHVAGIAVGKGSMFSGVAPDANLISLQVYSRFDTLCSAYGISPPCVLSYSSDQIAALEWVYTHRQTYQIAAANMSLGGGVFSNSQSCDIATAGTKQIIDQLRAAGVATVIAAGNNGQDGVSAPGCISTAISVGSTGMNGTLEALSTFSNRAAFLSLLAPGESINASVPGGLFGTKSGTSMAAPHVAGAWALMRQQSPDTSVDELLTYLQVTGVPIPEQGFVLRRIDLPATITYAGVMKNLFYQVRLPVIVSHQN